MSTETFAKYDLQVSDGIPREAIIQFTNVPEWSNIEVIQEDIKVRDDFECLGTHNGVTVYQHCEDNHYIFCPATH